MSTAQENMTRSELIQENQRLRFQVQQLNRLLFGAKRERFIANKDDNQMTLPFEVQEQTEPEKQQELITYVRQKKKA